MLVKYNGLIRSIPPINRIIIVFMFFCLFHMGKIRGIQQYNDENDPLHQNLQIFHDENMCDFNKYSYYIYDYDKNNKLQLNTQPTFSKTQVTEEFNNELIGEKEKKKKKKKCGKRKNKSLEYMTTEEIALYR